MDTVIDYINIERILGLPGKAIDKKELQCWTLPSDTQVDTGDQGITTVPGGHVIVELGPKQFRFFSIEEFNEKFVLAEDFNQDEVDEIEVAAGREESSEAEIEVDNIPSNGEEETFKFKND